MSWLRRLRNTLNPGRVEREIDRELEFHLAERIDQLRSDGLGDAEATRRARMTFGTVALQAERTRQVDVVTLVDARLRDIRYAWRSLGRTPGFTLTVVLTLGLGIGANTAVFSALDAVLLRPLPFPEGDRLMQLRQTQERTAESNVAPVRLEEWNRMNATFDALTGYYMEDVSETSGAFPERVRRAFVAPRFLDVWGIAPAVGRGFADAEHRVGGPRAVLISDRYWRVRLGARPDVLDSSVRIGSTAHPIIGVMPASFLFPDRAVDLWFPVAVDNTYAQSRAATWYTGIGRLKWNVSVDQARANLATVQSELAQQYPESDATIGVEIQPLKDITVGGVRGSMWLVFGAGLVLLLITCTNIAALLLARAADRQQEIQVRLSLGASQTTVAAQVITETLLLSCLGAIFGLLLASGATTAFRASAADLPRVDEMVLDLRILTYAIVTTLLVALLCAAPMVLRSSRRRLSAGMGDDRRTQVATRATLQWSLVGAQVALSVTLLVVAGLLGRSLHEISRVDPGFDASRVLTFRVSGNFGESADYPRLIARIDRTLERVRALPGVEAAATTLFLPGVPAEFEARFALIESPADGQPPLVAESRVVSPGYFSTLRIPVVEGSLCEQQPLGATTALMVNGAFARRYLSARPSAIGLHLKADGNSSRAGRIVGVVGDAREQGLDREPAPTVYSCISAPNPMPHFVVRTRGEPLDLAQAVRPAIKEIEPLRAVYEVGSLEDRIDVGFATNRVRTWLLALFAAAALGLACVGLYGTLSYVVHRRRREVGLRLALGAVRTGIIRQFVMHSVRVVGAASAVGVVLSLAVTRALGGMLYGVSPADPLVIGGILGLVLAVAVMAALIPAIRAARVEPMQILRDV